MSKKSDAKYRAYLDTLSPSELRNESKRQLALAKKHGKSANRWLLFSIIMLCIVVILKVSSMIWGF